MFIFGVLNHFSVLDNSTTLFFQRKENQSREFRMPLLHPVGDMQGLWKKVLDAKNHLYKSRYSKCRITLEQLQGLLALRIGTLPNAPQRTNVSSSAAAAVSHTPFSIANWRTWTSARYVEGKRCASADGPRTPESARRKQKAVRLQLKVRSAEAVEEGDDNTSDPICECGSGVAALANKAIRDLMHH